ncbi:MAG: cation diffusion facilitator family transporter [Thermodesulfobacteriota bacterium]
MGHTHGPEHSAIKNSRYLLLAMIMNITIPAAQLVGGTIAGSMAVISDAIHNLGDFTALFISFIALRIARKEPSLKYSFGYRRAEIMAALLNIAILFAACAFILLEAFSRIIQPNPVSGKIVIIMALIGIIGNGISVLVLHRGDQHNLNMRSALLHMVADLFTSVAVLINGIILHYLPWYWLDPLLSFAIVFLILRGSWHILKESTTVLMEGVPRNLDLNEIKNELENIHGVSNVHHMHAWDLGSGLISFSAHIAVPDEKISRLEQLNMKIKNILHRQFNIEHTVLEFESDNEHDREVLCCMRTPHSNKNYTSRKKKSD